MLALLALLVCAPQDDAPGSVGKMAWPPKSPTAQTYVVRSSKERKLSAETATKRKAAAKAAGIKLPAKEPQQDITLELRVAWEPTQGGVHVKSVATIGAFHMPWRWIPESEGKPAAPIGNTRHSELWGEAAAAAPQLQLPRSSFETPFTRDLRWRTHGLQHDDPGARFTESLLPVLWSRALPAWAEEVFAVLHIDGEHIIPGKAMIREHTQIHPLGSRNSRVEAMIEEATADRFRLSYRLRIDQMVNRTRDLAEVRKRHYLWRFEIEGELEYSLADGAFLAIEEQIVGRIVDAHDEQLQAIGDEEFKGHIVLKRAGEEPPPDPKKQKPKKR